MDLFGIRQNLTASHHQMESMTVAELHYQKPHQHVNHGQEQYQLKAPLRNTHQVHTHQFAMAHDTTTLTWKTNACTINVTNLVNYLSTCLVNMDSFGTRQIMIASCHQTENMTVAELHSHPPHQHVDLKNHGQEQYQLKDQLSHTHQVHTHQFAMAHGSTTLT